MPRRHDYSLEAFINIREARGQSSDSRQSYTSYVYLLVGAKQKVSWTVNSSLLGQGIPPAGWEQKHPKQHQFEYLSISVSEYLRACRGSSHKRYSLEARMLMRCQRTSFDGEQTEVEIVSWPNICLKCIWMKWILIRRSLPILFLR